MSTGTAGLSSFFVTLRDVRQVRFLGDEWSCGQADLVRDDGRDILRCSNGDYNGDGLLNIASTRDSHDVPAVVRERDFMQQQRLCGLLFHYMEH